MSSDAAAAGDDAAARSGAAPAADGADPAPPAGGGGDGGAGGPARGDEEAAEEAPAAALLADVSNSDAYTFLNDLAAQGALTPAQVDLYKSKYAQLHDLLLQTYEKERAMLDKAKALRDTLREEKYKLGKVMSRKNNEAKIVMDLEKEREKAFKEWHDADEREAGLRMEVTELNRQRTELEKDLEQMHRENAQLVEPELKRLQGAIADMKEEAARHDATHETLVKANKDFYSKIQQIRAETEAASTEKAALALELSKLRGDPARLNKQADSVKGAVEALQEELKHLTNKIHECDATLAHQGAKRREADDVQRQLSQKLEKHREDIEQRERDVQAVKKSLEFERQQHKSLLRRRVEMEMEQKEEVDMLKSQLERLAAHSKEFEAAKKSLKRKMHVLEAAKNSLPQLQLQLTDTHHQLLAYRAEGKEQSAQKRELKQEVEIFVHSFLRSEKVEKGKREELEELLAKEEELEKEREQWRAEEAIANKQIATLSAQREIKAREASKASTNERETREELKVKKLMLLDLSKKCHEVNARLKEFSALYDVVKNERNTYVNAIQASSQALAEMKEKIKILQNEVEILQNESLAKDKALGKERLAHQTAQVQRDALRLETNKCHAQYRAKQETVDRQIVEIDKLNSIINAMEREMLALKRQYERAVDARNYTGIQLIDRNDELCILYEKSNIHEATLRDGEVKLREKDQEVRMLRIQSAELEREIAVTRKQIPKMPEYAEQILELQHQLAAEREVTAKLCQDLETPENEARWRPLEGEDPDEEQLKAKAQVLEERLNDKKEQLLEKELVLEEVTALSDRLRTQAAEGRTDTLTLAKRVNEFQARIKETTRRMMAVVSELSMYQATAMKLQQEKHDRETELEDARWRLDNGGAPTEEVEHEWYRMERERLRRREAALQASAAPEEGALLPATVTRTTAEPRPNAYIPDEIGIPKPYGGHAPFKPSAAGSTMRHIRKPQPREIEI